MKALLMKAYDACAVTDSTVAIHINKVNSGIKKFPNYAELFIGKKDEMVTTRKVHTRVSRSGERIPLGDHRDFMGCARAGVLRERCIYHPWWNTSTTSSTRSPRRRASYNKNKDANVKPQHVKDKLFLILKSTIPNPIFNGRPRSSRYGDEVSKEDRSIRQIRRGSTEEYRYHQTASSLASATQQKARRRPMGKEERSPDSEAGRRQLGRNSQINQCTIDSHRRRFCQDGHLWSLPS
jgi:hypothetical protein